MRSLGLSSHVVGIFCNEGPVELCRCTQEKVILKNFLNLVTIGYTFSYLLREVTGDYRQPESLLLVVRKTGRKTGLFSHRFFI